MRLSLVLAVLLVAGSSQALERKVLPNGLTVIVEEDHRLPRAAVLVDYAVGAADDPDGMDGLAHLSEHALFLGTPAMGKAGLWGKLADAGAWGANGITQEDHSFYFETVPSGSVDLALWVEAQRMAFGPLGVDDDGLQREQGVVQHEHRLRESPWMKADRELSRMLLEDRSRYYSAETGPADVKSRNRDDVLTFLQSSYAPDAAALVVVGDVATDEVMAAAERYFGSIRRSAPPLPRRVDFVKRAHPGEDSITVHGPADALLAGWAPSPGYLEPDDAALDLLGMVLEERLRRSWVEVTYDATEVHVTHPSLRHGSIFRVLCVLRKGVEPSSLVGRLSAAVKELGDAPVTQAELEGARQRVLRMLLPADGVLPRADQLARYERFLGDPGQGLERDRRRYRRLGAEDLRRVAQRYLTPGQLAVLEVETR